MEPYSVFRARPEDQESIEGLLSYADKLVLHVDRPDTSSILQRGGLFVVRSGTQVNCICGLAIGSEEVAMIKIMALFEGWSACAALRALLPAMRGPLQASGIRTLAYVGMEEWLIEGLLESDFRQVNTIITLQKNDFNVPSQGNPEVTIRPARPIDMAAVLEIDRAVFAPIWRNSVDSLDEYLDSTCTRFCIAQVDRAIAGYQCLSLIGRHGHLTRVAVSPRYQGRQIAVRLLAEAIAFFEREGVYGVTLNTQEDNRRARRLYRWFGFRVLGREAQVLVWDLN